MTRPSGADGIRKPVLKVSDVRLSFGGIKALDGVSFEAFEGSVLGVVGPNGAGKTALLNVVCGVYTPQQGTITFTGHSLVGRRPEKIAALGIGRTFQGMDHFSGFTVADYVLLGRTPRLSSSAWGAALLWPAAKRGENRQRSEVLTVLEGCGLEAYADEVLKGLPYGIQKQVDIARVIASDCQLVLLDEPTSGTTSSERELISASVQGLIDSGVAVLLIDHDIPFVRAHCDRLLAMNYGRVLAVGSVGDVLADPLVREVFLGIAT